MIEKKANNSKFSIKPPSSSYDVIVIGAGHAGVEAACSASRLGSKTLLISLRFDDLGVMSCNPAFGGVGKGHLVREVDALDGVIARAADRSAIQYRELNRAKGMAVRGPRVQADRNLYQKTIKNIVQNYHNLTFLEDEVKELIIETNKQKKTNGVITVKQGKILSRSVILTTGTFLNGIILLGKQRIPAGRAKTTSKDKSSVSLAKQLIAQGLPTYRLKTGTPARLKKSTINFNKTIEQKGDEDPSFMSFQTNKTQVEQISCYITETNQQVHDIIKENLMLSPTYNGDAFGTGPRYCPSIEDKVHRFFEKQSHQIFLEPEAITQGSTYQDSIYPNGISTALPKNIQDQFLHKIKGLADVAVISYGYAIEYDAFDPRQLEVSLESKIIDNLFLAGQVNGTTGYEEAAAQGLIAGINATFKSDSSKNPFILNRAEAYIGVMIDDLITKGATEPYRMFTSRAEYRISLRADTADIRLTPTGLKTGLISDSRKKHFNNRLKIKQKYLDIIKSSRLEINGKSEKLTKLLVSKQINLDQARLKIKELKGLSQQLKQELEADYLYSGYLLRQRKEIDSFTQAEDLKIPNSINYQHVGSLSNEVRQKLANFKPASIGSASRMEGMTPGALAALIHYIKRPNQTNA